MEFVKKHTATLLIPFILFYLLSYPFRIVVELWDYRSLDMVSWNMIFDVFKTDARSDYLYSNVPLWFLLCLFWVQLFYWVIFKLPLWVKLLILTGIWIGWDVLSSIPTPFMINNALCCLLFFGFGQIMSKLIFQIAKNKRTALYCLILGCSTMLLAHSLGDRCQFVNLFYLAWCLTMLMAASLSGTRPGTRRLANWLEFFGLNTLLILGAHLWFLIPIMRLSFKINGDHNVTTSILGTVACAFLLIPTIVCINRHFPILAGKKRRSLSRNNELSSNADALISSHGQ